MANGRVISGEKDPASTRGVEETFVILEKKKNRRRRRGGGGEMLFDGKYPRLEEDFHPRCNAI